MSKELNQETGLAYANTDPSLRFNGVEQRQDQRWRGAWIYCLKNYDYDAAELIVSRNLVSDECEAEDHDDCHFSWCQCNHHSSVQFALEHPQLTRLAHVASEEAEMEYV